MRSLPILLDADEAIEYYKENRVDPLTDAERALVVSTLHKDGYKNSDIRKVLGIPQVYTVTHLKRVGVSLTDMELSLWHKNPKRITFGHVRAVAKLPHLKREPLLRSLLSKRISVSEFERIAKGEPARQDIDIARFETEVSETIGRPLALRYNKVKRAGRLTVSFYGLDDLDDLLAGLGYTKST